MNPHTFTGLISYNYSTILRGELHINYYKLDLFEIDTIAK